VVADVTHPLNGIDFLYHFDLLVDCKHNRLLGRRYHLSGSLEEHEGHPRSLIDRRRRYGIIINPAKGIFRARNYTFFD
jgi:hypothetical protein